MAAEAQRTLAVISDREGFGDAFWRLHFIRALKRGFPDHRLAWLSTVPTYYVSTLAPIVAGLVDEAQSHLPIERPTGPALARLRALPRYDLVIDIRTAWKRVALAWWGLRYRRFVTHCAGIPSGQFLYSLFGRPRHSLHRLLRLAAIAAGRNLDGHGTLPVSAAARARAAAMLPDGASYVALGPGATGPIKCWPLANFEALGRRLVAEGHVPVILIGPDEYDMVAPLRAALPTAIFPGVDSPEGRADLDLLLAIGERLALAVVHDTGPAHMLAALGVPLVSLFGPTDPTRFMPVDVPVYLLDTVEFGGRRSDSGGLGAIPPDAVWDGVATLLARRRDAQVRHPRLRFVAPVLEAA
ncbi:MAG: glycosyltransferase family 9 protein [Alphaproteobacteria bacterium]|nr:glycosyltransferase family 9 protein [Alphaproteobacteria bacterium]